MSHRRFLNLLLVSFFVLVGCASMAWGEIDAELLKKAKAGDAEAQFHLATMYYVGEGVAQDYAEAAKWIRKAAEQGDAEAQYNLGIM